MILTLCHDALIVGGGPAGCTLAIALARAGRHAVLIEKSKSAQHKVCGEFLSPESLPYLRRIGIHPEELGAQTIHSMRVAGRDVITEVELPSPALSLTRRTLDESLLLSAQHAGVSLLRGYTVEHLSRDGAQYRTNHGSGVASGLWHAQIKDTSHSSISIHGQDAFLATGKHDLRGWQREARGTQDNLVALKMYFVLSPEQQAKIAGHVELILYSDGYAGLQPVESGMVNLCALITRDKLRSLDGRWDRLLEHMQHHSPHLARRLSGARQVLDRPLALSAIPYGYCVGPAIDEPSPWRLGDQAAVIPSFCGDGMGIALYTAERAAELYLSGSTSAAFHAEARREFKHRLYYTTMLSRLMIAMPAIAQVARLWPSALTEIFTATRLPGSVIHAASH
ncbi:NAD(P)/FAD-dependent oxidoreductase [Acidicapsa ligni]|uniref:NAD(P)/FAD-dependent oxidoreductase n=1 Tax=Acidicapsa ligni TaxID=542300 RepID=UPI0021DF5D20|nr:FAD-dependent monooxygenase [Acidicapsa ligni]